MTRRTRINVTDEEERGPGRPEVGTPINVRLPVELLASLDAAAMEAGVKRAQLIRRLVRDGLAQGQPA